MKRALVLIASIIFFTVPAFSKITGPYKELHPRLKQRLHVLERHFGHVHITPHGGCRLHGNRRAPKSYHRIAAGCKAADIIIKGVSKRKILAFWKRKGWGGTGYYCGRPFVHVDVGPVRSWTWFCGKRKRYAKKKK